MTSKEDIIRMAREAGFADGVAEIVGLTGFERFASLVLANNPPKSSMAWQEGYSQGRLDESLESEREAREAVEAEREACAKIAEYKLDNKGLTAPNSPKEWWNHACQNIRDAIRARGDT